MKSRISVKRQIIGLFVCLVITFIAAGIGSSATMNAGSFYLQLTRPEWTPPASVFGPVWTVLYLMMGLSLYLVWITKTDKKAFTAFGVQLFLNALWSVFFFGLRNPLLAFIEIIFLWAAILLTIIYFYRINKNSAYLLIPYILWVSFAAVLNFFIFYLN